MCHPLGLGCLTWESALASIWFAKNAPERSLALNKYQRKTPKPRNWKRLSELVLPMTTDVMREGIKQSTTGDCSPGLDGMGKPLWHALVEYLAVPMTITMQWQLSTGMYHWSWIMGYARMCPRKIGLRW